jgi:ABC-2 type transport system ATP-binding protein
LERQGEQAVSADIAIETRDLTKRYGERVVAVRGLNMSVRRGEVYGFLGPNGAGKTTTLRMLVGLIRPSAGRATVLGAEPGSPAMLCRVGAMIESPAFYPYLSGRDNLRVLALYARVPAARIDQVLARVQLSGRGRDKFATYSLGMKQRLGVAAALLKDPELLILDEPANGLDPAGMADMRALIRNLALEGRTVLLSSHLMGEVEQTCDRIGVIRAGSLVAEGTLDSLRGRGSVRVRAEPLDQARQIVERLVGSGLVSVDDGGLLVAVDPDEAPRINRALVQAGVVVEELRQERSTLEEIFLDLTREERADHVE